MNIPEISITLRPEAEYGGAGFRMVMYARIGQQTAKEISKTFSLRDFESMETANFKDVFIQSAMAMARVLADDLANGWRGRSLNFVMARAMDGLAEEIASALWGDAEKPSGTSSLSTSSAGRRTGKTQKAVRRLTDKAKAIAEINALANDEYRKPPEKPKPRKIKDILRDGAKGRVGAIEMVDDQKDRDQ